MVWVVRRAARRPRDGRGDQRAADQHALRVDGQGGGGRQAHPVREAAGDVGERLQANDRCGQEQQRRARGGIHTSMEPAPEKGARARCRWGHRPGGHRECGRVQSPDPSGRLREHQVLGRARRRCAAGGRLLRGVCGTVRSRCRADPCPWGRLRLRRVGCPHDVLWRHGVRERGAGQRDEQHGALIVPLPDLDRWTRRKDRDPVDVRRFGSRHHQGVEGRDEQTIATPAPNRFTAQLDEFSECVLTGKAPEFPAEDGLRNSAVLEALHESAGSGRSVTLDPEAAGSPRARQDP